MDLLSPIGAAPDVLTSSASKREGASDPLRRSADELASSFMLEMLKGAKFGEAFGGGDSAAQAFNAQALGAIADQMTEQSPALADMIYQSLSRQGDSS